MALRDVEVRCAPRRNRDPVNTGTGKARIEALDTIRGVAVMGILLLNIVSFAMPQYAYVDPTFYGGDQGTNWWAWAVPFVLADGKMRGLFTMLFGASIIIVAERALASGKNPLAVHYARMASLLLIGLIHGYLIWSGDILALYALCGALAFAAWRLRMSSQLAIAAILMLVQLSIGVENYLSARHFEARATAADAPAELQKKWLAYRHERERLRAAIPEEIKAYQGNWRTVQAARASFTWNAQRIILPASIPDTIALMLIGMALYRSGFFSGRWSHRQYRLVLLFGYGFCLPLYVPIVTWLDASRFDPMVLALVETMHLILLRPMIAGAYGATVVLLMQENACRTFWRRISAAGRVAFTNYVGTSVICTLLFYGYGAGWFGLLERWQLYPIVLAIWLAMLAWSKPWLDRFAHGPLEWLWRSLAHLELLPFRRRHSPVPRDNANETQMYLRSGRTNDK